MARSAKTRPYEQQHSFNVLPPGPVPDWLIECYRASKNTFPPDLQMTLAQEGETVRRATQLDIAERERVSTNVGNTITAHGPTQQPTQVAMNPGNPAPAPETVAPAQFPPALAYRQRRPPVPQAAQLLATAPGPAAPAQVSTPPTGLGDWSFIPQAPQPLEVGQGCINPASLLRVKTPPGWTGPGMAQGRTCSQSAGQVDGSLMAAAAARAVWRDWRDEALGAAASAQGRTCSQSGGQVREGSVAAAAARAGGKRRRDEVEGEVEEQAAPKRAREEERAAINGAQAPTTATSHSCEGDTVEGLDLLDWQSMLGEWSSALQPADTASSPANDSGIDFRNLFDLDGASSDAVSSSSSAPEAADTADASPEFDLAGLDLTPLPPWWEEDLTPWIDLLGQDFSLVS
ncbi:hypothetical protein BAUCODRAFT_510209 [Baudoinia panamericana UAMH 10762]|uniref:Uncharacterized protein n=1 Tax=Baudoinia panamericana (strain UAMH 10762) TaxID=717646 RepID=M2MWN4_BAUPA|nr:uncharacterized protein BAUCODRAFT_510209 [Baudoinia panamericana UAMH 10762]EMC95958.1 hypothetical protein BAUCODRAFT_510209 [Baudoinia panamericana UAMH 10762]